MARATEPIAPCRPRPRCPAGCGPTRRHRPTPRAARSTAHPDRPSFAARRHLDADAAARENTRALSAQRRRHGRPRTVCAAVRADALRCSRGRVEPALSREVRALAPARIRSRARARRQSLQLARAGARQPVDRGFRRRSSRAEELASRRKASTFQRHPPHGPTLSRRSSTALRPRLIADATGPILLPHPSTCRRAPMRCLHVGASTPLKLWDPRRWRALAASIEARGLEPVWSAGRGEDAIVRECAGDTRYRSYAAALSLPQLWRLTANASLLVAPDTGVAHLGRIVGTPTVALFGPGSATISGAGEFWRDAPYRRGDGDPVSVPRSARAVQARARLGPALRPLARRVPASALHGRDRSRPRNGGNRGVRHIAALRMRRPTIVQFNLSPTLGGAEVYTAFFSRALEARGWPTRVVVSPGARFWDDLDFGGVTRSPLRLGDGAPARRHRPHPHFLAGLDAGDAFRLLCGRACASDPVRRNAAGILRSRRPVARGVAARRAPPCSVTA